MTETPPPQPRPYVAILLFLILLGGLLLTFASFAFDDIFPFVLLASARVQASVLFLLLGILTIRRRYRGSRALAATGFMVNALPVLALWMPGSAVAPEATPAADRVRVVTANVFRDNERYDAVLAALDELRPDILVLTECKRPWPTKITKHRERFPDRFPHVYIKSNGSVFSLAVLSRFPLHAPRTFALTEGGPLETTTLTLELPQGRQPIVATHLLVPTSRIGNGGHLAEMKALTKVAKETEPSPIVVGDLNITPFNRRFQRLLDETGLLDTTPGFGWQPTFPAQRLWAGAPIDHVLIPEGVRVAERFTATIPGSDHRAVVVDLVF